MIRSKLCFAAAAIIRDGESNIISAFNVFEGLVPTGLPLFLQQVSCFALWQRDDGDPQQVSGNFTATLDGDTLANARILVDFAGLRRSRSIVNMQGFVVPRSGVLQFRFVLETGATAEYSLDIDPPPAVAAQAR
jgi:hypothetical protein